MTDEQQGTIDAFTDADSEDTGDETPTGRNSDADSGPDTGSSTYRWDPDGAACADCGDVVERRWRAAAGFVCPDCKWG